MKYIRVARLFAPGAHFYKYGCRVLNHSFVVYRNVRFLVYCILLSVAYRLVRCLACYGSFPRRVSSRSRGFVFAEFLSAYRLVFVSRIVNSLRFVYRPVSVSRNKLLKFSCIALVLRSTIVDGLLRDSAIPEATPSSQCISQYSVY